MFSLTVAGDNPDRSPAFNAPGRRLYLLCGFSVLCDPMIDTTSSRAPLPREFPEGFGVGFVRAVENFSRQISTPRG